MLVLCFPPVCRPRVALKNVDLQQLAFVLTICKVFLVSLFQLHGLLLAYPAYETYIWLSAGCRLPPTRVWCAFVLRTITNCESPRWSVSDRRLPSFSQPNFAMCPREKKIVLLGECFVYPMYNWVIITLNKWKCVLFQP
ncbi:unnamed protein product, partial [Ixodes pacificus]